MYGYSLISADVNGDGAVDVVTGDAGFPVVTVLLNEGHTAVTLSSSSNPSSYGQPVVPTARWPQLCRAQTAPPTGTVSFLEGGSQVGSSSLSSRGQAFFAVPTLSADSHVFSAAC